MTVTPEMAEAGREALRAGGPEDVVIRVYEAMERIRLAALDREIDAAYEAHPRGM